ncbi:DUF7344 domain-containing protein [Halorarum salinum]|uniref:DUF7344 domain-containing protein n=1 Tax=Halorarum salinum TaxID=2743089 RepID=A0A7D5QHT3_9EURY|nr:hypothetical protein [Halobaculum salinum]QLG63163.1 hypothetical protein HUG12_16050 [Halobaculum salinum]
MEAYQMFHETDSTMFEVLAHHRRRYAIHCLREYENPITLADLADEVSVLENDTSIAEIPPEDVKRVYLSLYHSHVPKLADAELVTYDQERDLVSLVDSAEDLDRYYDRPLVP